MKQINRKILPVTEGRPKPNKAITSASLVAVFTLIQACAPNGINTGHEARNGVHANSSNREAYSQRTSIDPDARNGTQANSSSGEAHSKTFIYRHLTAVRDYSPDVDSVWNLCMRQQEFHEELPTVRVLSSREIKLPVKETNYVQAQVTRYQQKQVTKHESRFGIQLEPIVEDISVPYVATETQSRTTKGTCVGSEYILSG